MPRARPRTRQRRRAARPGRALCAFVDVAADHAAHDVGLRQRVHRPGVDVAAVAQHHHAVGDLLELVEPMRDVDHGHAARLQQRDLREEVLGLARGEGGGGLVEDQQAAVAREAARDLHHLLVAEAERAHEQVRVDVVQADGVHAVFARTRFELRVEDEAGAMGQSLEQQVLGHGEGGHEAELLQHHAHAQALGLAARGRPVGPAREAHRARARRDEAGDDLRQRALARAVLAREGEHLARMQVEIDLGQHGRRVALAEAAAFEECGPRGVGAHGQWDAVTRGQRRRAGSARGLTW